MSNAHRGAILCVSLGFLLGLAQSADARPSGFYGSACSYCHTGGFLSGRQTNGAMVAVQGDYVAEIPPGEFGDPDRGEGPLATYDAVPGGTFQLRVLIKNPQTYTQDPFTPSSWALGLKRIYATDPDYQAGNPNKLTWRDNQLQLVGAQLPNPGAPDPSPIPLDETGWTLHTDASFLAGLPEADPFIDTQFYTSGDVYGHAWSGSVLLSLTVTVPAGVLPGWYDIELSSEGLDTNFLSFYDEAHFYLRVVPEPATAILALAGLAWLGRRRPSRRAV